MLGHMLAYQSVVSKVTKLSQSLKRKLMGTKDLERAYESGCDAYRSKAEAFPNRISPQRNGLPLRFIFPLPAWPGLSPPVCWRSPVAYTLSMSSHPALIVQHFLSQQVGA